MELDGHSELFECIGDVVGLSWLVGYRCDIVWAGVLDVHHGVQRDVAQELDVGGCLVDLHPLLAFDFDPEAEFGFQAGGVPLGALEDDVGDAEVILGDVPVQVALVRSVGVDRFRAGAQD